MPVIFHALPTLDVCNLQAGHPDFYGHSAERTTSSGSGTPCRHCLSNTPAGETMRILSYRPFENDQPYAEVRPIFLCGKKCEKFKTSSDLPPILQSSPEYLVKGYCTDDRIVYGTGEIVSPDDFTAACDAVFADTKVAYIHVRSAINNCYMCKITRTL